MIDYQLYSKIRHLCQQDGLTAQQIARHLAMDVRTVKKWLEEKQFKPRESSPRASKLDPFKRDMVRLLEAHPYTAIQLLQRLREQGFEGGYSIVKDYVRKVRPSKTRAFLTLSFAPGECAQVDWGLLWDGQCRSHPQTLEFLRHGPLLQPHDVCGVQRLANHGTFSGMPPKRFRVLRIGSPENHGR